MDIDSRGRRCFSDIEELNDDIWDSDDELQELTRTQRLQREKE